MMRLQGKCYLGGSRGVSSHYSQFCYLCTNVLCGITITESQTVRSTIVDFGIAVLRFVILRAGQIIKGNGDLFSHINPPMEGGREMVERKN